MEKSTVIRVSRTRLRLFVQYLRRLHRPLLQDADLAICFLLALEHAGDVDAEIVEADLNRDFRRFRDSLLEYGGLDTFREGGKPLGYIVGIAGVPSPEEAVCYLDPFIYISHLSAMVWHGLTDRLPKTLFLTRPSNSLWHNLSDSRLRSELGGLFQMYKDAKLPVYRMLSAQRMRGRPLNIWSSSRLDKAWNAAFKRVNEGDLRVANIGRCFLDMVREPDLCGGINHVVEVYENHGKVYFEQIIAELDAHGTRIEQARSGYLLERSYPAIKENDVLHRWASKVTRGGSRKLDPSADYSDSYSERWALSINV